MVLGSWIRAGLEIEILVMGMVRLPLGGSGRGSRVI